MKVHILKRDMFLRKPLHEVFEFFQKPENLERITPPFLAFKIVTPRPIVMRKELRIDYTIRVLGFSMAWTSLITEFDPPYRFVDEQIAGPYRLWHHEHTFREIEGGTMVSDRVQYALPLGPLGELAHRIFVKSDLEKIFNYREQAIRNFFSEIY
jgi:ligand-binding SRPBCC domain-containing protein